MRFGTSLTEPQSPQALGVLRDQLKMAVDEGFSSAWMANIFGLDALTALAVAGHGIAGIEIGTAVVPTYPRHPAVLAQQALTAALAIGSRLALGIGLSHKIVIEDMYGYGFDAPAAHMSEYLSILLPLLSGEPVAFEGKTMRAGISLSVPRTGEVPVLLAALGPQMLKLAGQRTAGTILWMTGPATVRDYIVPTISAAAQEAGKPAPRVVCILPVCVTDDPDGARARAAKVFEIYGQLPSYRAMLDREGAQGPADVAIVGNEDQVASQITALADCGVTDFVAGEYARGDERRRTRQVLTSLITALT
ncbi:MAG TPA: TIGR03564 family F420-dependent LLM class oxidoreductase [Streptosporangiaceae bacterium]|nr:TIGR03564 family F420-dependent LLM class oxidoreductase [Streptosporangiaceae bacterium]